MNDEALHSFLLNGSKLISSSSTSKTVHHLISSNQIIWPQGREPCLNIKATQEDIINTSMNLRPPAFNKYIGVGIYTFWDWIGQNEINPYLTLQVKWNSIGLWGLENLNFYKKRMELKKKSFIFKL